MTKVLRTRLSAALPLLTAILLAHPAESSLVAHYPLDGNASDVSGNGNHGVAVDVTTTADRLGNPSGALLFNGTSSAINTFLDRSDYDPAFTVAAWIRFDGAIGGTFQPIVAGDAAGPEGPFFVGKDNGTNNIGVQNGPPGTYDDSVVPSSSAWNGSWHHIAAVFDGTSAGAPLTCLLYVDGILSGIANFSSASSAASVIFIGHEVDDPTVYFLGAIDEVQIYDHALSAADVLSLAGGTPSAGSLIAHYPLDGDAVDASGNGNDGVATNASPTSDRFGNPSGALHFNGTSSSVWTPLNREDYDPSFTVTAWFRYDGAIGGDYAPVIAADGPGSSGPFFVGKDTGNANIGVENGNYNPAVFVGSSAWNGNWHHVAMTFNASSAGDPLLGLLYVDGDFAASGFWTNAASAASVLYIGHEVAGPTVFFDGAIDDVRFYNYALAPEEVALLAEQPVPVPAAGALGLTLLACALVFTSVLQTRHRRSAGDRQPGA
jgi:hypothetical protein